MIITHSLTRNSTTFASVSCVKLRSARNALMYRASVHWRRLPLPFTSTCSGLTQKISLGGTTRKLPAATCTACCSSMCALSTSYDLWLGNDTRSGSASNCSRTPNAIQLSTTASAPMAHQYPRPMRSRSRRLVEPAHGLPSLATRPSSICSRTAASRVPPPALQTPSACTAHGVLISFSANVCFARCSGVMPACSWNSYDGTMGHLART